MKMDRTLKKSDDTEITKKKFKLEFWKHNYDFSFFFNFDKTM